jgi:hypothetical protein
MVDEEPPPDRRTRVNLDACQPAPELGNEAGEEPAAARIEPVGDAMKEQNMYARIGQQTSKRDRAAGSRAITESSCWRMLLKTITAAMIKSFPGAVPRTRLSR